MRRSWKSLADYFNIRVALEGGYDGYETIAIYGDRKETKQEEFARLSRMRNVRSMTRKQNKKRKEEEFDLYLKLKEKYDKKGTTK